MKKLIAGKRTKVGLISGGTGVTPMYSIALASSLAQDGIDITFLNTNKTQADILIKGELDALEAMNPNLRIFHTLTRHNEERDGKWDGLQGRLNLDLLK